MSDFRDRAACIIAVLFTSILFLGGALLVLLGFARVLWWA